MTDTKIGPTVKPSFFYDAVVLVVIHSKFFREGV